MIKIANNPFYSIYVNPSKNRVYLTLFGFWAFFLLDRLTR